MATIRKRISAVGTITDQVPVREKGCPPESNSFLGLTDAMSKVMTKLFG